ncbi:hybrid sensor histidine kinase/response regulator transcription factor [Algibacter mikhailovii]|uniref:hybrid sensor histidine kinase/response regulator transcription factor n=1 Tax=Algibacter mikhailovii TaxID=425498 RepID=UPI0024956EAF|nr:two-component regulator propeller domain-containing protein [Algibacter mikhailovii]
MKKHSIKAILVFRITYFTLALFLFGISQSYGQNSQKFERLTTANGLSQSDVNAIYQDDDGFMWFGTHDGLNRYDGYNFTVFKPNADDKNSISSNLIWKIIGDENGNLWIGTTGGGLNYFDKKTETFKTFKKNKSNKYSLQSNYITLLYKDSKRRLWIGSNRGLDMIDLKKSIDSLEVEHFNIFTNNISPSRNNSTVNVLFEDKMKQLWKGDYYGLSKLSINKNGDQYFKPIDTSINFPGVNIRCIAQDGFNNLIIGTSNALYRFSPEKESDNTQLIRKGAFTTLSIRNNQIWAGTLGGLIEFDNSSATELPRLVSIYKYDPVNPYHSLSKDAVKSLFIDKTGIVWVGTNGGGVNKFDPQRKQFRHINKSLDPNSLSHDKVRTILEDSQKNLWVGTEGGGLNMLSVTNRKTNKFIKFDKVNNVFALEEIHLKNASKLFIGVESSPGLYELDLTDNKPKANQDIKPITEVRNSVFSILQDRDKNVWVGTYRDGVYRWLINNEKTDFKKDALIHYPDNKFSLPSNIIRDIFQDSNGNIWFATGRGLCRLKPDQIHVEKPKFNVFQTNPNNKTSISHNYVLTIAESKSGVIWVGTLGGGLNKVIENLETNTIEFKRYSEENGLPNNVIKDILEDDQGNLWLSTNKGLSRFNPKAESFQNYDVNDGLQNNEFSELTAFKKQDGEMLFGGVNGFNAFYPNEITNNEVIPVTILTNFSIFNKPVKIGDQFNGRVILDKSINTINEIDLKYDENSFSFEFAALHYSAPQKNNYAYTLKGFNNDWIYTTSENRIATYTNLAPGYYTLKVKSSNNDNIWNEKPVEINIKISPPFWRTNLAYLFYLALAIVLLLAFRRFTIIRSARKHQLELEHVEKDKHEEIQRLKLEFFTNISHEFRTPLTLIKGPLDYLIKKGETISPKEVSDQYGVMRKNTNYLLRLINQLLDFRKMDHGKMNLNLSKSDIVVFLKEVAAPFQFLSRKKNISFEIKASKNRLLTWFDPEAIEKIVNNLLSNAFKFTPDNGSIAINLFDGNNFKKPDTIDLELDQSKYIIIQVRDSGPGIPSHRIQHVFERFYTEIGITNDANIKGAGIGLSFTKNLVELHQGIIKVQSDPESGTTFYVWLPKNKEAYNKKAGMNFHENIEPKEFISQEVAESNALSLMDDIVDNNITKSRSKLPVLLIIDDNADIRAFIKKGFGENYYIYEAENGEKGLQLAKEFMPNIIITDLMMPIMNGIEFCNELKSTQETSHIPVVMLTAKTSQEKEIEGLKTGADAYIRKPFDLEILELKLSNILRQREELRKKFNREITLQPSEVTVTSSDEKFLKDSIAVVEKHMMNSDFSVSTLMKEMTISRSHLFFKIKELTGLSTTEFIRNIRLKRAVQLLEKGDFSVKETMYMTGFNTASYFSKCFKKQFGVIPSKYIMLRGDDTVSNETDYEFDHKAEL